MTDIEQLEKKIDELTKEVVELKETIKIMGNAVIEFYDSWRKENEHTKN